MKTRFMTFLVLLLLSGLPVEPAVATAPPDPLAAEAAWQPPEWSQLRGQVLTFLDTMGVDGETRQRILLLWPESEPTQLSDRLERLIETLAIVDPDVGALRTDVSLDAAPRTIPAADWLTDAKRPPFISSNCRLYLGRWAVQHQLYDEAFDQLDGLTTDDVIDPAALLFYQAVARQRLLQKNPAVESLDRLLLGEQHVPTRYLAVARLMRADLEELENDSLDHIARRMEDIRRRLHFGRADQKVREIEDGVIESLDKLIEKAKQRQQQQQQQSGMPSGNQPVQPASDSRLLPGRGPGEVTKKEIGDGSGWGDLPPKEREAALQQIGREFPAHYRDAIEQYFRRLAGSENTRE